MAFFIAIIDKLIIKCIILSKAWGVKHFMTKEASKLTQRESSEKYKQLYFLISNIIDTFQALLSSKKSSYIFSKCSTFKN